ncbi:uncharacterized protein LOC115416218 [Sphaeramia orbicularis]|uniref:uncharacterized protein LOC115416218 n=1 Tax=Sphaeramia orbicularis TaxID=375764 RepID=UPI00117C8185|nr:uncharacterized protein LOC115416218 [Sphaeramia orbicularis]
MDGTRTSLWLFVLINQLPLSLANDLSTMQMHNQTASSTTIADTNHTNHYEEETNVTRADCLMDNQMGLIALGSAGGLIVCLLLTTVVLTCQICHIQRRVHLPRSSRSNMDLVSSAAYWGPDRPEAGGLVGPCDTSVMLEEVGADSRMEQERHEGFQEEREEAGAELEEGATAVPLLSPEAQGGPMQTLSSASRDSCLEVPRDLEDMPLVV